MIVAKTVIHVLDVCSTFGTEFCLDGFVAVATVKGDTLTIVPERDHQTDAEYRDKR